MKVLTAAEMREVDRLTTDLGIAGPLLMENAGHRVVEFLERRFAPLRRHRIVVLCGKGNNGGDGLVVARQLHTRFHPEKLWVVMAESQPTVLPKIGCEVSAEISPEMRTATLVVDALLGFGLQSPARGRALELIREINNGFPLAKVVAVDLPSGMYCDTGASEGDVARADYTVTFTALKVAQTLAPNCDRCGEIVLGQIGSPASLYAGVKLHQTEPADFTAVLEVRKAESNKGSYGHVLVIGGSAGKTGAASMTGLSALRAGAGLVTVASAADEQSAAVELMSARLPADAKALADLLARKAVVAIGPGLGTDTEMVSLLDATLAAFEGPVVVDADGLNALAGRKWSAEGRLRVLTPHPGELARLTGLTVSEVQRDRLGVARRYAEATGAVVVLKGHRTVTAMPDGRAFVNPTGTPALAKAGSGDVLTGIVAGFAAQFDWEAAVLGAVYLHGLAAQLGAEHWGDKCLLATDVLTHLPEAMRRAKRVLDGE